ncbi:MAG: hypothetical protein HC767_12110 [Akkermansiaceae bacterium]|nr:hypothetical protein [Akkermansiaceae bacterium]
MEYVPFPLNVKRYRKGQFILPHSDSLEADGRFMRATVAMYLNDAAEGGRTRFRELGVSVTPRKGRALLFYHTREDGTPDPAAVHSARLAVDTKWIVQTFLWQNVQVNTVEANECARGNVRKGKQREEQARGRRLHRSRHGAKLRRMRKIAPVGVGSAVSSIQATCTNVPYSVYYSNDERWWGPWPAMGEYSSMETISGARRDL